MFTNIGGKIKALAVGLCLLGMLISAFLCYNYIKVDLGHGLFVFGVGSLISWFSTFVLYGFGELIDRTSSIDDKLNTMINLLDKIEDDVHK